MQMTVFWDFEKVGTPWELGSGFNGRLNTAWLFGQVRLKWL